MLFISKVEYRAVIWYLYLKDKTGKEMHPKLADVTGSSAPSYAQIKFWVGEFKPSRMSLEDDSNTKISKTFVFLKNNMGLPMKKYTIR